MSEAASAPSELYGPWRGRWRCVPDGSPESDLCQLSEGTVEAYRAIRDSLAAQFDGEPTPGGSSLSGYCEVCWGLIAERHDIVADRHAPLGRRSERFFWYASKSANRWDWSGPVSTYEDLLALIGEHEHNLDVPPGQVRYYTVHPTGPFKAEHRGTWFDVIEDIPLAIIDLHQPPTLDQVNLLLAEGGASAGMSGGIEIPRHRLSESEWAAIYRRMVEIGRFTEDRPPAKLDTRGMLEWLRPHHERFRDGQRRRGRR